jgi:hypothetical protein
MCSSLGDKGPGDLPLPSLVMVYILKSNHCPALAPLVASSGVLCLLPGAGSGPSGGLSSGHRN